MATAGDHPVVVSDHLEQLWVKDHLAYRLDSSRELSMTEFLTDRSAWQRKNRRSLNFAAKEGAVWGHLEVKVPNDLWHLSFGYPLIDTLEVWFLDPEGQIQRHYLTGSHFEFEQRPVYDNMFRFPLLEGSQTIVFRAVAKLNLQLPLELVSEKTVRRSYHNMDFYQAIYVGILILAILGSVFIGIIAQARVFFAYVGHLIGTGFITLHLGGYAFMYIWPDHPIINRFEPMIFGLGVFSTLFSMEFLNTRERAPRFHRILWISVLLNILVYPLSFLGWQALSNQLVQMIGMIGCFIMLIAGFSLWRSGYRPARFFTLAWSVFLIGVIVTILQRVSVLPLNDFTLHASQIGSALDVVLFFFALADKVMLIQRERDQATNLALEVAQRNEMIIKEKNRELNTKVEERTAELSQKNAQLEELTQQQNQLFSLIGHDLRGPIGTLGEALNLLRKDASLRTEDFFDMLRLSTNQAYLMLNNILYWAQSKQSSAKIQPQPELCLSADILNQLEELFSPALNAKKISLEREETENLHLWADREMLGTVLRNLLSNAIKFSPEKSTIHLSTQANKNFGMITIRDEGIGMNAQEKEKLFEIGHSKSGTAGESGTGLGMVISKTFVEAMSGELEVKSEPGRGSEFKLSLPLRIDK